MVSFVACKATPAKFLLDGEGYIPLRNGKVWYKIVGTGDKTPILLLHGGPGCPSYYLKPLEGLGIDRKVIFFDQLGCGRSTHFTDIALMNIDSFVEELSQIVRYLGLKDYYLYGHSWGTMLATDFYLKYPQGIRGIILNSPAIDMHLWERDADMLVSKLPDSTQKIIQYYERIKDFTAPAYQHAMLVYYHKFLAIHLPWSPDLDSSINNVADTIYHVMTGPSEFTLTGNLKNYNRIQQLKDFRVPTLFVCGEYDEAQPATVKYYQHLTPHSIFAMIPNAGHVTMQDQPQQNNQIILSFLDSLERVK